MQKGGVLYASDSRSMAAERAEDEIECARGTVNSAANAEAKKAFIDAITAKRREILKVHTARKKQRKEFCKGGARAQEASDICR